MQSVFIQYDVQLCLYPTYETSMESKVSTIDLFFDKCMVFSETVRKVSTYAITFFQRQAVSLSISE